MTKNYKKKMNKIYSVNMNYRKRKLMNERLSECEKILRKNIYMPYEK